MHNSNVLQLEERLKEYFVALEKGWSNVARVVAKAWLRDGLKPRCITRDLKWGIPVPVEGFENKVFYVWFDAPFGYISITKRYTKEYKKWWQPPQDTKIDLCQFMAKDNVPFHTIMFPACLLAADQNYTLMRYIMATGMISLKNAYLSHLFYNSLYLYLNILFFESYFFNSIYTRIFFVNLLIDLIFISFQNI